jgi:hypothetical protein
MKLGKLLGMEKQPSESQSQYCDRVAEINQRRINDLPH